MGDQCTIIDVLDPMLTSLWEPPTLHCMDLSAQTRCGIWPSWQAVCCSRGT